MFSFPTHPKMATFTFRFPPVPPCDHTIDQEGDVLLSLKNTNAGFAIWDETTVPEETQGTPAAPKSVVFRVSSHHLKLASPVFKAALTGVWIESVVTKEGYRQVTTTDWDAEAFRIFLAVIHGRNYQVPHAVTLETLCKIAVVVDYYQCYEAFSFCSKIWVAELRDSIPVTYGRDLILWLCVSWVFQVEDKFEVVTKLAIETSYERVRSLQLPLPGRLIGAS